MGPVIAPSLSSPVASSTSSAGSDLRADAFNADDLIKQLEEITKRDRIFADVRNALYADAQRMQAEKDKVNELAQKALEESRNLLNIKTDLEKQLEEYKEENMRLKKQLAIANDGMMNLHRLAVNLSNDNKDLTCAALPLEPVRRSSSPARGEQERKSQSHHT